MEGAGPGESAIGAACESKPGETSPSDSPTSQAASNQVELGRGPRSPAGGGNATTEAGNQEMEKPCVPGMLLSSSRQITPLTECAVACRLGHRGDGGLLLVWGRCERFTWHKRCHSRKG